MPRAQQGALSTAELAVANNSRLRKPSGIRQPRSPYEDRPADVCASRRTHHRNVLCVESGTACGRRGGLPRSEWETANVRGQSSKTFRQIALRRCWSSRTSSRTSVGLLSRCQSRSRTRADSASLATAEATAALIAYAAAPRSWAATWAIATACPAAKAANFAGSGSPRAAAFATKVARSASRAHLAADPGTTDVDSVRRAGVARLLLLEKAQDVFGAAGGPLPQAAGGARLSMFRRGHGDQSGSRSAGRIGMSSVFSSSRAIATSIPSRRTAGNGPIDQPSAKIIGRTRAARWYSTVG